ncbi:SagB/ThcOx family dehydrogenase [Wukongibacter baidiensis]|uniref:SagB/ThcOx family dehydrogenase n=1 Tax=Wukongibacter baidiensis TaxID=1723361 RepID=UPI003D7FA184
MNKGIGHEFLEKTKYQYLDVSDQDKGIKQPPLEQEHDKDQNVIDLPDPKKLELGNISLVDAIEKRTSVRKYANKPLSLEELSYLLWCTQGVKQIVSRPATLRNVPSAGARHAFETYLLINNVEGLKPGLYRFLAIDHKLVEINLENNIDESITVACLDQIMVKKSAVTFIWVADLYRMKWRYQERAYRYLLLDAGHVCQNLYLAAEGIDSGVCAIAAYDDDVINDILDLDGKEEFVTYIASLGKK